MVIKDGIGEDKGSLPDLDFIFNYLKEIQNAGEILERNVVATGNGAHINIPLKHLGKKAKIILMKKEEEKKG